MYMKKTFKEITRDIDMVLFNKIISIEDYLELEAWEEFYVEDEEEIYKDIYQYFAVNENAWKYISNKTWMPLYYSEKCDLFILWVDFLDNWENMSYEI